MKKNTRWLFALAPGLVLVLLGAVNASATIDLEADPPSGQFVGTTVTWTVHTLDPDPLDFRFAVAWEDEPPRVLYDFTTNNVFEWTPLEDGLYHVVVSVRNRLTGTVTDAVQDYVVRPRATWGPAVAPTSHPLVALYSAPSCPQGYRMRVACVEASGQYVFVTDPKPCRPAPHTMNFYVGGMIPNADHFLFSQVLDDRDAVVSTGIPRLFHTGSPDLYLPWRFIKRPPGPRTSLLEGLVLFSPVLGNLWVPPVPLATDLRGRVRWYYKGASSAVLTRPVFGGRFLMLEDDETALREVNLAGQVVRETTIRRINEQLLGMDEDPLTTFHHEARLLPNGYTVVLGYVERLLTDVQGPGPVNVIGDCIVVLDEDWQVTWVWNAFNHLDVTRTAILGETCQSGWPGCPAILYLGEPANDWLHSNAIVYSPTDGNLLLSVRHQDWIIKIDYRDGAGTGDVLWRLGPGGDFTLASGEPSDWFSHQHDPNLMPGDRIVLYDNGNTRCAGASEACNSRGQVYTIDEELLTAALDLSIDLGNYSFALGSAQPLLNGNLFFSSGVQFAPWHVFSTADEFLPDGSRNYSLEIRIPVYRSFRMMDLYRPPLTEPQPARPAW